MNLWAEYRTVRTLTSDKWGKKLRKKSRHSWHTQTDVCESKREPYYKRNMSATELYKNGLSYSQPPNLWGLEFLFNMAYYYHHKFWIFIWNILIINGLGTSQGGGWTKYKLFKCFGRSCLLKKYNFDASIHTKSLIVVGIPQSVWGWISHTFFFGILKADSHWILINAKTVRLWNMITI